MKRISLWFLLTIWFALLSNNILGCTYIQSDVKISKEEVKKYYLQEFKGAVFIGKVQSIKETKVKDELPNTYEIVNEVTIDVEKYWVGVEKSKITVYTGTSGGDCGADFELGERYFFNVNKLNGILRAFFYNTEKIDLDNDKKKSKFLAQVKFFDEVFGEAKVFQNSNQ